MKIYQILPDLAFHSIGPVDDYFAGEVERFDCRSKWREWIAAFGADGPLFRVKESLGTRRGNFFHLAPGVIVHDREVADDADEEEILGDDMEFLPARLEDPSIPLCVKNVTGCYNCLDLKRTDLVRGSSGEIIAIRNHVFNVRRVLDSSVFKISESCCDSIYALSGRGDDDFFEFYQRRGYTGLIFKEVWKE